MPALRFLADESCDYLVVRTLRAAGHDVAAVVNQGQRSVDAAVIARAFAEQRILLTEDKDFGWHVFVARPHSPGVVLIRFPASMRMMMAQSTLAAVETHEETIETSFIVVEPGRIRLQKLPWDALTDEVHASVDGRDEFVGPLLQGERLTVIVIPEADREFANLVAPAGSILNFWDNPLDDKDWNAAVTAPSSNLAAW